MSSKQYCYGVGPSYQKAPKSHYSQKKINRPINISNFCCKILITKSLRIIKPFHFPEWYKKLDHRYFMFLEETESVTFSKENWWSKILIIFCYTNWTWFIQNKTFLNIFVWKSLLTPLEINHLQSKGRETVSNILHLIRSITVWDEWTGFSRNELLTSENN